MHTKILCFLILSLLVMNQPIRSQAVSVQGGLSQPLLLQGVNVAATYYGKSMVFEYSHGSGLRYDASGGIGLSEEEKAQNLKVYAPYSTGFGIGYLIRKNWDIRVEIKENLYRVKSETTFDELALNQFFGLRSDLPFVGNGTELWLPNQNNQTNPIELTLQKAVLAELLYDAKYTFPNTTARYRTRSVGLGMYYRYFPLGGEEGLMIEPSVRYWPNIWTDAPELQAFENKFGVMGLHKAHDNGLFVNVSLGYYKTI